METIEAIPGTGCILNKNKDSKYKELDLKVTVLMVPTKLGKCQKYNYWEKYKYIEKKEILNVIKRNFGAETYHNWHRMFVEEAQTRHEQVTSANLKAKWWKLLYRQILSSNNRSKGFIGTTSSKPPHWNPERQKKSRNNVRAVVENCQTW